jgi:hypothetical protein
MTPGRELNLVGAKIEGTTEKLAGSEGVRLKNAKKGLCQLGPLGLPQGGVDPIVDPDDPIAPMRPRTARPGAPAAVAAGSASSISGTGTALRKFSTKRRADRCSTRVGLAGNCSATA